MWNASVYETQIRVLGKFTQKYFLLAEYFQQADTYYMNQIFVFLKFSVLKSFKLKDKNFKWDETRMPMRVNAASR